MKYYLLLIISVLLAVTVLAQPVFPEEVSSYWNKLIGKYSLQCGDHFYLRENNGTLEILYNLHEGEEIVGETLHFNGIDYLIIALKEISENEYLFTESNFLGTDRIVFYRNEEGIGLSCKLGKVFYNRRFFGEESFNKEGGFRIEPVKPVKLLRPEALKAEPPEEEGDFLKPDLVNLKELDDSFLLDIRYATENNFMGSKMYELARAYMQRPAAEALVRVNNKLHEYGLGLIVYDAYRPWYVTKLFWDATPDDMKNFVANPISGSRHNRGSAVDLGLYDLDTGKPIEMISAFDEFSERAYPDYPGGTTRKRFLRDLLIEEMKKERFTVYPYEWWHFDYYTWNNYGILNVTFGDLE
ncbi:MAG: M15 family metallopeptidase [Kosmotoga sp.]|nr:MAG: M15 family metallopeptidase [Kosmotoga sp.]